MKIYPQLFLIFKYLIRYKNQQGIDILINFQSQISHHFKMRTYQSQMN